MKDIVDPAQATYNKTGTKAKNRHFCVSVHLEPFGTCNNIGKKTKISTLLSLK